ncbi:signal peptidase I [Streptomyces viridochromogenes DSM 40736]|uniref:Signal peptidase I n=1 Tax=Streptomyces viridochromogenes (strain DSM 40736 / JCM 4977 / BCRC 1201 / Tue 494) TaxID=591159 RepID=D9XGE8_STRVT|nr:signal peptidase I [Streptomyces viridochromogenes]EFL37037.1 signal peptidase I [Streptomyces viridochromogenes DSM 40736]
MTGGRDVWGPAVALTVLTACGAGAARRLLVVTVRGTSMTPTHHHGDQLLVRRTRTVRRGQVVVVLRPRSPAIWREDRHSPLIVKRVAAVPGDPVPPGSLPQLAEGHEDHGGHEGHEGRVPPGRVVLLGDNAAASVDSRQLGFFPLGDVLGVVARSLRQAEGAHRR